MSEPGIYDDFYPLKYMQEIKIKLENISIIHYEGVFNNKWRGREPGFDSLIREYCQNQVHMIFCYQL